MCTALDKIKGHKTLVFLHSRAQVEKTDETGAKKAKKKMSVAAKKKPFQAFVLILSK